MVVNLEFKLFDASGADGAGYYETRTGDSDGDRVANLKFDNPRAAVKIMLQVTKIAVSSQLSN